MSRRNVQHRRDYQRLHRRQKRLALVEYLKDKKCIDCGMDDIRTLDFDHLNPQIKKNSISTLIGGRQNNWKSVKKEIKKCVIRCSNCHRQKTIGKPDWYSGLEKFKKETKELEKLVRSRHKKSTMFHGTDNMYNHGKCRCDLCKEAHRIKHIKYRQKQKQSPRSTIE